MNGTALITPMPGSIAALLQDAGEKEIAGVFRRESSRMLRIDVDGGVWLRPGAAIAYRGDLAFVRRPTLAAESASDAVLRETAPLVRAVGRGRLFCGNHGLHVRPIHLADEALVVAWSVLLAFEDTLAFETTLVGHGVGIAAGGLAAVTLSGRGALALAGHGEPLALHVAEGTPVFTDPHATIAWSPSLSPSLKTDLGWRSLVGHGGGEPFQMRFDGKGFVIVQPYKEPSRFKPGLTPVKRLASLLAG